MPKHGTSETFAFHQLLSLVSQTGRIIKSDPILSFVTVRCTDRIILNDGVPGITYFIVSKHAVFFCVFSTSRVAPLRFRSSESVILCVLQEESRSQAHMGRLICHGCLLQLHRIPWQYDDL